MSVKQTTLTELLTRWYNTGGLGRIVVREQIRLHFTNMNLYDAIAEIKHVRDAQDLNVLLGVGMSGALYYAVVGRKAELMGL